MLICKPLANHQLAESYLLSNLPSCNLYLLGPAGPCKDPIRELYQFDTIGVSFRTYCIKQSAPSWSPGTLGNICVVEGPGGGRDTRISTEAATHLVLLELLDISGHLLLCLGLGPLLILSCKKNQGSEVAEGSQFGVPLVSTF